MFQGFPNVSPDANITMYRSNITTNNGLKIIGKRFQTNDCKYFFFDCVVTLWNKLTTF